MTVPAAPPELLFWPGSLGARGYGALLAAAEACAFTRMAISPLTMTMTMSDLLSSGMSTSGVLSQACDHRVTLTQLDGVASWAPAGGTANTSAACGPGLRSPPTSA